MDTVTKHRLVVIGGGFAGVSLVRPLRRAEVEITLVDKKNHHLFQPLLYQVATGGLSPANIATPLRELFRRQPNCRTVMGEATEIDLAKRTVHVEGFDLPFDTLVVAAGAMTSYFGNDAWRQHAIGLKSVEEATEIRSRLLTAFERAELATDDAEIRKMLTFVITGGGPTGVEMAGAISELAYSTLKGDFRTIDSTKARILLIDGGERLLGAFAESSSARALTSLLKMGVEVWTKSRVKEVEGDHVKVERDGQLITVPTETVIWAAGVKGEAIGAKLAAAAGTTTDRAGRLAVQPDLSLKDHSNVFVVGDLAAVLMDDGKPVPGVAQGAMQMGAFVAGIVKDRLRGKAATRAFVYHDKGNMATIGRARAVVELHFPRIRFGGFIAWLAWLLIHLLYLVQFQNKILVLFQWAGNYFTRNKSALIITHRCLRRSEGYVAFSLREKAAVLLKTRLQTGPLPSRGARGLH